MSRRKQKKILQERRLRKKEKGWTVWKREDSREIDEQKREQRKVKRIEGNGMRKKSRKEK